MNKEKSTNYMLDVRSVAEDTDDPENEEVNSVATDTNMVRKIISKFCNKFMPIFKLQQQPSSKRENWGKGIEFLFSCIAMSVGLGNIWRFPIGKIFSSLRFLSFN